MNWTKWWTHSRATPRKKPGRPHWRRLGHEALEDRIALTVLPSGFTEMVVADGLTQPTSMAVAPDGRIFVTEQTGNVRVVKNGTLLDTPFLTLNVNALGERGLLGLALDPNFPTNQLVYVYYTTATSPIHNRVSRFTANGDVVVGGSEQVLLDLNNLSATNHNGGAIHFGADGKLYIAVGENAVPANSQSLENLLGKVLRINPDGTIPSDNPFFNTAQGNNRAIWALGLRNPFTFAVQPGTGRIFINDVGQSSWEEINDGIAGANYGWPTTEGPTSNPQFVGPVFAYPNFNHPTLEGEGCSIAGGVFYNPAIAQFPSDFVGDYFFADLCGRWIRQRDAATGTVTFFATDTAAAPVDLDVGLDGSLLYLSYGEGEIRRIARSTAIVPTVVAPGPGMEPRVEIVDALTGDQIASFLAYDARFGGGVRVATGDMNLDGAPEIITAAGAGGGPHVRVFDGNTLTVIREFMAYNPLFTGGVFLAAGDIDGDGRAEIVTSPGAGGGPHVRVFSGLNGALQGEFFAYNPQFFGGVQVALGDFVTAGVMNIITGPGAGGGPHVRVFDAQNFTVLSEAFVYDAAFRGGVFVAAGDVAGDARAEIITGPGFGGGPHVRVFDQSWNVHSEFMAYAPAFRGGVRVGVQDLDSDGTMEIITGPGPGGGPHVRIFGVPGPTVEAEFFAYDEQFTGGIFVASVASDLDLGLNGFGVAASIVDFRLPDPAPVRVDDGQPDVHLHVQG